MLFTVIPSVATSFASERANPVTADRRLFERLCRGEENAMAAVLRGALVCSGDVELLFAIQWIFPGPPRERQPQSSVRGSR